MSRRLLLHMASSYVLASFVTSPPPPSGLTDRCADITQALCRAVAACLKRGLMTPVVLMLVWKRVRRAENLLRALVERMRAGTLRGGWVRVASAGGAARVSVRSGAGADDRELLPRRFGWLIPLMPHEAALYAFRLSVVLAEPEMVTLLREVPQARRILRPLCHMLGLAPKGLAPKRSAAVEAVPVPRAVTTAAIPGVTRAEPVMPARPGLPFWFLGRPGTRGRIYD